MEGKQHDNGLMENDGVFTHEITSVENGDCSSSSLNGKVVDIARTLHGSFLSPSYLNTPGPAATVHLSPPDEIGMYHRTDVSVVKFLIRIPCSVYNGSRTVSTILQYGHGLFGSRAEAKGEYLGKIANKYGMIIVATDWKGMSKYDVPMVCFVCLLLSVVACCCCS